MIHCNTCFAAYLHFALSTQKSPSLTFDDEQGDLFYFGGSRWKIRKPDLMQAKSGQRIKKTNKQKTQQQREVE